jgi:hypothetical protein
MIYEVIHLSNELDILDLRLHEHCDAVDFFIIVEFPYDYARNPRKMHYNENKERFKKFEKQIIHHIDDSPYNGATGLSLFWQRVGTSFPVLAKYCKADDYVIFCDGDALIKRSAFDELTTTNAGGTLYRMKWSVFWFNTWYPQMSFDWTGGCPYFVIQEMGSKVIGRPMQPDTQTISDGGWHLSKMGGVDAVIENIKGFPHQDMNTTILTDPVLVQQRIDNGWGWNDESNGTAPGPILQIDPYRPEDWPKFVDDNPQIFDRYFKGGMGK